LMLSAHNTASVHVVPRETIQVLRFSEHATCLQYNMNESGDPIPQKGSDEQVEVRRLPKIIKI